MKGLNEYIDYYINKDGLIILTKKHHLEKDYCCGNGCPPHDKSWDNK